MDQTWHLKVKSGRLLSNFLVKTVAISVILVMAEKRGNPGF